MGMSGSQGDRQIGRQARDRNAGTLYGGARKSGANALLAE